VQGSSVELGAIFLQLRKQKQNVIEAITNVFKGKQFKSLIYAYDDG